MTAIMTVIFALALGAASWWWFVTSRKPHRHRNLTSDRFSWLIRGLVETMRDGSVLVIEHEGSDRFTQFARYSEPSGEVVLSFGFPDAGWSSGYFEELKRVFSQHGIDYTIAETGDAATPRFMEVECRGDVVESGARLARLAFEVMGAGKNARFCGYLKGDLDSGAVIQQAARAVKTRLSRRL